MNGRDTFHGLIARSEGMRRLREMIAQVAGRDATVLIMGEVGTGKELVARAVHEASDRRTGPFVVLNAAGLATALDDVLHPGADGQTLRATLFDPARGGTLFIDRVDETTPDEQGLLLRWLDEHANAALVEATAPRLLVAASTALEDRVRAGQFREELYFRLNVFPIRVPPLRERADDLADLLDALATRLQGRSGVSLRFDASARRSLGLHTWPGNVRELTNLVERLSILHPDAVIGLAELPPEYQYVGVQVSVDGVRDPSRVATVVRNGVQEPPDRETGQDLCEPELRRRLAASEREMLEVALDTCAWDIDDTAVHLQTNAAQLDQLMKKHGVRKVERKQESA